ncbi:M15 family metallopeptidase [Cellulomonas fimi]|uniref:M15 family metallopeptidase n=1 Tax=Cellulomonas sp. RIT-PI-Y TaxID=3035297 RepID=UPI0021DB1E29
MSPAVVDDGSAGRRDRRARTRRHHRTRLIAAGAAVLLIATGAVAGALALRGGPSAPQVDADALALSAELTAQEQDFLSDRSRTADVAASRQVQQRAADRAAAAAQAQAEAEAAAAAAAAAAEQAAAEEEAARAAAAEATSAPPGAPTSSRIAGWVDGRPVDANGNVLWVTSVPTADGDGSNGHMPMSAMCAIGWGTDQLGFTQYLRCDAADALTALNDAYRAAFGASLDLDLTYRSYEDQVAMKAALGGLAATPGTSSHGLGLALDVQEWPQTYGFGTERYQWLVANAPTYGWYAPDRVREGQPYAEYWHFEYGPGRSS